MALLSLGVSAYALVVYGLFPPGRFVHPEMRVVYAEIGRASCRERVSSPV